MTLDIELVHHEAITRALGRTTDAVVDLRAKPRIHESLIKFLLFACGIVSIFTTIGIVVVLGRESIGFFTRTAWENTNKPIVAEVNESVMTFEIGNSGAVLEVGERIRLGDEIMRIGSLEGTLMTVERALDGTTAQIHREGLSIETASSVSLIAFFTNTKWAPQIGEFGVLPLLNSTLMISGIAMLVAVPLGLSAAIFMSEYASPRVRSIVKPVLEILAGVPTVVFGYFALTFMTPLLRGIIGDGTVKIFNTASAGIVVGVLIIPLISSMAEDALHAVPTSLREASYGLGATKLETSLKVVLPAALSGVIAALIVAVSRAIGETMIVAIAAGAGPNFTLNPFESAETMTGHIARISGGDLSYDSIDYNSIFAIGLTLFVMTLILNLLSRQVIKRFREAY